MKKVLFAMMAVAMMVSCGNKAQQTAQNDAAEVEDSLTGAFTAYDLDGFKLHVYNTNDVMGDAAYIIEASGFAYRHGISALQGERQGVCCLHREAGQACGD